MRFPLVASSDGTATEEAKKRGMMSSMHDGAIDGGGPLEEGRSDDMNAADCPIMSALRFSQQLQPKSGE